MPSLIEHLHNLRYLKVNSKTARGLLGLVYREGEFYRLPFGPNRGLKMWYESSVNFHAILGLWDPEVYRFFEKLISRTKWQKARPTIVDMGANIGYFSMWAARRFGATSTVFSFEPAPKVLEMLKRNLSENHISNAVVVPKAISDRVGEIDFFESEFHHVSSLHQSWASGGVPTLPRKITVPCTTLDQFFESDGKADLPDFIKIDIEGGGTFALKGMDRCTQHNRPLIWMESHTPEEDRAISEFILKHDYQAYRLSQRRVVSNRTTTHPDPNGVWGSLLLFPTEKREDLRPLF